MDIRGSSQRGQKCPCLTFRAVALAKRQFTILPGQEVQAADPGGDQNMQRGLMLRNRVLLTRCELSRPDASVDDRIAAGGKLQVADPRGDQGVRGDFNLRLNSVALLKQVEKCRLLIREAIKACEEAGGQRTIPAAAYDSDGELDQAHIFCAQCDGVESFEVSRNQRK